MKRRWRLAWEGGGRRILGRGLGEELEMVLRMVWAKNLLCWVGQTNV